MTDTQSTSAALRQTQGALAASQADLTAMQAKRDDTQLKLADALEDVSDYRNELKAARQELEQLRSLFRAGNRHRDGLLAEIDRLREELKIARIEGDQAWDGVRLITFERDQLAEGLKTARRAADLHAAAQGELTEQVYQQGLLIAQLRTNQTTP